MATRTARRTAPRNAPTAEQNDRRRGLFIGVIWTVALITITSNWLRPWPDIILWSDFVSFWTGATLVRDGAGPALFDMETQRAIQVELRRQLATDLSLHGSVHNPYHSPPPLALLFVPLTALPYDWAYLVWWGMSLLALVVAVAIPWREHPQRWTGTAAVLTMGGVAITLIEGQVNTLFLLAMSLGLRCLMSQRPSLGGALFGLLWLKPQYALLFALVFLVKGRWRELAGMAATGLGLAAVALMMVGPAGIAHYLTVLNEIGSFYPPAASLISPEAMINWRSILMHLWPGIPEASGYLAMMGLGLMTGLVSLLVWRGPWDPTSPRFGRQMLVVTIATLLASPHSHAHGTVLLLAPLALTLAHPTADGRFALLWPALLILGYLLSIVTFWPLTDQRWLMAPYLVVALGLLVASHE